MQKARPPCRAFLFGVVQRVASDRLDSVRDFLQRQIVFLGQNTTEFFETGNVLGCGVVQGVVDADQRCVEADIVEACAILPSSLPSHHRRRPAACD